MRNIILAITAIILASLAGTAAAQTSVNSDVSSQAQSLGLSSTNIENVGSPTFNSEASDSLETVPSVDGPSLGVGTNPCLQVASGSANWLGFGGGFGATYNDRGCEIRNLAALITNMGYPKAGTILLANYDRDVAEALEMAGDEVPASVREALFANPATPPADSDQPRSIEPVAAMQVQMASTGAMQDPLYESIDWSIIRQYDLPHWCNDRDFDDQMSAADRSACFGV